MPLELAEPREGIFAAREGHAQDVCGSEETHAAKPGEQELCAWL